MASGGGVTRPLLLTMNTNFAFIVRAVLKNIKYTDLFRCIFVVRFLSTSEDFSLWLEMIFYTIFFQSQLEYIPDFLWRQNKG